MGDFFLDFRSPEIRKRGIGRVASSLRFFPDIQVRTFETDSFSLVTAFCGDAGLWAPYATEETAHGVVGLAGRLALEDKQWEQAHRIGGDGGLACKAVWQLYCSHGLSALHALNGNFALVLYDAKSDLVHLVTDRCGVQVAYHGTTGASELVFSSHPDVLSEAIGESTNWDRNSLAEFLTAGHLSYPFTYFDKIRALDTGSVYSVSLEGESPALRQKKTYFDFTPRIDRSTKENDLAEELASAFKGAVARRSSARFGPTAVGLSGGLDSRTILACTREEAPILAFTLYDDKNTECLIAERIATAAGVHLHEIRREFEYYGNSAELGVRISGGTGCLMNNHYLGVRNRLIQMGASNMLTGCYIDYVLKGLALNTEKRRLSRRDTIAPFCPQFYRPHYPTAEKYSRLVSERLGQLFPEELRRESSEESWFEIQRRRTFPLAYEADLMQRVIPQRVLPWFLPISDNDILDVYLRMPFSCMIEAHLFRKAMKILCPQTMIRIPDSNSGARIDAHWLVRTHHKYISALKNRTVQTLFPSIALRGSWPNWAFYVQHSDVLRSLWERNTHDTSDIFKDLLGYNPLARPPASWPAEESELFLRILTQKLWLEQRLESSGSAPTAPSS